MVCSCGSTSGCKTSKCECKKSDFKCDSDCECNPDVCTNRRGCKCSTQSKCVRDCECRRANRPCDAGVCGCSISKCENKTAEARSQKTLVSEEGCSCSSQSKCIRTCECTQSNRSCTSKCSCDNQKCQNSRSSSLNDILNTPNIVQDYSYPQQADYTKKLTEDLRIPVTNRREAVIDHRKYDLYTGERCDRIEQPEVDHIIEDQILGHAAAPVLFNMTSRDRFVKPLSVCLNDLDNYNVTHSSVNRSKGAVLKNYLNNKRYLHEPLRATVLTLRTETYFKKYLNPITSSMDQAGHHVLDNIDSAKREDNHVSGRECFDRVADQLSELLKQMDLNPESGIRTRKKTYK